MLFSNNILREKLKNIYFIWGRGKTTIANELKEKYGCYVYSTDDSRYPHLQLAMPEEQPYMCRDFEAEYGVKNFWLLPPEVILEREEKFLSEMTPMIIADLIELSAAHEIIICEGDIDYEAVAPIATHMVYLCNLGSKFDFFNRPDHDSLEEICKQPDLTDSEKELLKANARYVVSKNEGVVPAWVIKHGVKNLVWDDTIMVKETAQEVAEYFRLNCIIKDEKGK